MNLHLEELNVDQKKAVTHGEGPLLIIAGAGTGKTKVLTHRIAYLISAKLARPEEILAVTFTEKAANEMEERVDLLIPYSYSFVEISTFNSFGERVLRNYAHEMGYNLDFKLLDEVEQTVFFRQNLFRFPLAYYRPLSSPTRYIQEILIAIRRLKQEDIKPDDYLAFARKLKIHSESESERELAFKHQEVGLVYKKYQKLLKIKGMIDFEDQVTLVLELFRKRPSILKEYQDRYKYILVDEFQDTNHVQFEMLKLLAGTHNNITVVGDDDQSIFRFRGASLSNILNFRKMYPEARRIVINRNYRSTQAILDAAYRLIQHNNPFRLEVEENIDKTLESSFREDRKSIYQLQFGTLSHEADRVAEIISEKIKGGYRYGDMAILVRRNADADAFLRALNMREIPFRFSGSRGLYSQNEVRILLAFINALTDFENSRSLFYLALCEIYGMPVYDLTVISNYAHKKNLSLHKVFQKIHRGQIPVAIQEPSIAIAKKIFQDLLDFIKLSSSQNAGEVVYSFLEKTGFLKSLMEVRDLSAEIRLKNIRIFFDTVRNFTDISEDNSIYAFARHLDLLQQVGDNPATAEAELEEDAVNVLTVHKAKGLEFPVVFMVGLIADRFPGSDRREKIPLPEEIFKESLGHEEGFLEDDRNRSSVREERRLFYVGMTRAKKDLYLTWSRDYGLKRLKKVSPFVLEALDLSKPPEEILRLSSAEEIKRYGPQTTVSVTPPSVIERELLPLSFLQIDDYLTCPLKYRYRHVLKVPVLPHYNVVFGRVLHDTIHHYLKLKTQGKRLGAQDLIKEYNTRWINEGFLSREHEEMKKKSGEKALRRFFSREESSDSHPHFLEKQFRWQEKGIRFSGRWDRIDLLDEGAVIIDFKASQVKDQAEADRKVKQSLQMDVYGLSFQKTMDGSLLETRLHFLESDIVGCAVKGEKEFDRAEEKIEEVECGIRKQNFSAKPDWHHCNLCNYKNICPSSYAY